MCPLFGVKFILVDREPGRSLFDPDGLLSDLREYFKTDFDLVTKKALPPALSMNYRLSRLLNTS
jgi:predicted nucleotidyltransferase